MYILSRFTLFKYSSHHFKEQQNKIQNSKLTKIRRQFQIQRKFDITDDVIFSYKFLLKTQQEHVFDNFNNIVFNSFLKETKTDRRKLIFYSTKIKCRLILKDFDDFAIKH